MSEYYKPQDHSHRHRYPGGIHTVFIKAHRRRIPIATGKPPRRPRNQRARRPRRNQNRVIPQQFYRQQHMEEEDPYPVYRR